MQMIVCIKVSLCAYSVYTDISGFSGWRQVSTIDHSAWILATPLGEQIILHNMDEAG